MSGRLSLGMNVFDAALARLGEQYEAGHRLVVSVSGGKDSTVCLELAVLAAAAVGRLPVDAVTRDEEIQYPGTYEYLERTARRDDVNLVWLVANQPIINAFDRHQPYWWVFDPLLDPADWVRQPPPYAVHIADLNIQAITSRELFPPPVGGELRAVIGIRAQESPGRMMGVHSAGGYLTGPIGRNRIRNVRPIYDWTDADVWLAVDKHGWDYNHAYDVMNRHGIRRNGLRIGPPTMSPAGGELLQKVGRVAWPDWWDRVCRRLPSVRSYALYGQRAVMADRRYGETWKECFHRSCITEAPEWIAERAVHARDLLISAHRGHCDVAELPEVVRCFTCQGGLGSWRELTKAMYLGDPFAMKMRSLSYVEPERFRPGAGTWNGSPSF